MSQALIVPYAQALFACLHMILTVLQDTLGCLEQVCSYDLQAQSRHVVRRLWFVFWYCIPCPHCSTRSRGVASPVDTVCVRLNSCRPPSATRWTHQSGRPWWALWPRAPSPPCSLPGVRRSASRAPARARQSTCCACPPGTALRGPQLPVHCWQMQLHACVRSLHHPVCSEEGPVE